MCGSAKTFDFKWESGENNGRENAPYMVPVGVACKNIAGIGDSVRCQWAWHTAIHCSAGQELFASMTIF